VGGRFFCVSEFGQISTVELSLRDILGRIPGLESLYQLTFNEEVLMAPMGLGTLEENSGWFTIDSERYVNRRACYEGS
jgi:hypothetical protein